MFKLRKENMEKIKNVLLQLSSNGNWMTGEIERQRLQSELETNMHHLLKTMQYRQIVGENCMILRSLVLTLIHNQRRVTEMRIRHL